MAKMAWYEKGAFKHFSFSEVEVNNDAKVVGQCNLCPGTVKISGRPSVSSNFNLHLKVCIGVPACRVFVQFF